jgi:hypothetical protein
MMLLLKFRRQDFLQIFPKYSLYISFNAPFLNPLPILKVPSFSRPIESRCYSTKQTDLCPNKSLIKWFLATQSKVCVVCPRLVGASQTAWNMSEKLGICCRPSRDVVLGLPYKKRCQLSAIPRLSSMFVMSSRFS